MKRIFYHSILSLFLLVMFCITGGGNLAKAQSTVTLDFEGSGAFPYNADWTITNLSVYSSLNHTTSGRNSASTSGKESAVAQYKNKLENISKVVYYISKTTTNTNTSSYFLVETSTDGSNWVGQGLSPTFDKITQGEWTEVTVTLATPVTGYVRVSYKGSTAVRVVDDITVYYTPAAVGTTDPEISYSASSFTIAANGTLTQPELKNPNGVTIKSYSSDNESVATVTGEGVIALAGGTGTAKITATSQANATYKEGTATYTLTVFGAPEITPESGEYENNVAVVMNATDARALFYTTDGTDPKDAIDAATKVTEFPYNLPLSVGTHTIKAVTADESLEVYSDVLTRTYTVVQAVPTPQLSQAAGNYNYEVAVDVTVANSGGAVGYVYTTDGTDPATSPNATTVNALTGTVTLYEGEHTLTVKSFTSEKANFSDAATAAYTVSLPQPVITLSAESTQEQPITVTIEAEGAPYIWYTTDGTDPLANGVKPVQVEGSSTSFTLSEVGTYTITAVGVNNNVETSAAATAFGTINKVIPVPGSAAMKYKKVTSEEDVVDGGVYLLACPSRGYAMSFRYPSKAYTGAGALSFPDGEDIILSVENLNTSDGPCEITLEKVADKENVYYLRYANGGDYIYSASSNASNLGFSENLPTLEKDYVKYEWKISFVDRQISKENTDKVTALSCLSNYSSRCLDINWNVDPVRYATYSYAVANNAPSFLYKKTFDLSVNANTAGYATAYTAFPYVMPAGADGYIVTETAEGATIKAKQKYPAGTEVPAYAPLLIKNSEAGVKLNPVVLGKTVEAYNYVAGNAEAVAAGNVNLLHGTRRESDGVTTDVDGTNNYYYYKLSYKLDAEKNPVPDSYGFYRGKADGSAFAMQNTLTAYLALPRSSGLVNNLRISIDNEDGPATSIQTNRLPADNMPQSVYTLSGVRVNAAGNRLPKGIYIVNGKKVVIK